MIHHVSLGVSDLGRAADGNKIEACMNQPG